MRLDPQIKERLKKTFTDELVSSKQGVTVYSTYPLTESEMQKILVQFPQFASRTAQNKLDTHLIGGLVIQSGSEFIDLSIRNALHLLKKQLYESN